MALLLSPQFWIAVLTFLGTVVGYIINKKIKADQAAAENKARQEAEEKKGDQDQVNWANDTAHQNDQIEKQRKSLDDWQKSSER